MKAEIEKIGGVITNNLAEQSIGIFEFSLNDGRQYAISTKATNTCLLQKKVGNGYTDVVLTTKNNVLAHIPTWGGSRGGGRPKKQEGEKKGSNITFRPSPEVAAILPDGDGNRTIFIENSILMRSLMMEMLAEIAKKLPQAQEYRSLIALLNSFNDTLSDEEILVSLRRLP